VSDRHFSQPDEAQLHRHVSANKKLSYRRETARRFLSWNILLSHSMLLKVIWNDTVE